MRKIFINVAVLLFISVGAQAQLGGLLDKVKSKTKQRADQRVDKEIDKTLDQIEGKKTSEPVTTEPGKSTTTSTNAEPAGVKSFSRYDFIPGEQVLYYDNFEGEAIAELPTGWNTSGSGEVVTLDKYPGNWLRLHKSFIYLSSNQKEFGENYTAEFDVLFQFKWNGWGYPEFRFGFFASKDESNTGNNFLREYRKNAAMQTTIYPSEGGSTRVKLASYSNGRDYFQGTPKVFEPLEKSYGTPVHVAIQVQKERCRIWINETKVFDVPKGIPAETVMNQIFFEMSHTNYPEDQYGVYISNIKVATGKPDTRHKLIEEGKFATTGILFDFQSAVIRPESYGVVKEIAGVLKENPGIKIKIVGHTSSDGDDKANMELSKKRAAAVKDLLSGEFGLDAANLETEGKGESQPIADNKTKEGKALNRRVEFIKTN